MVKLLELIGTFEGDRTVGQVALNWLVCKEALPMLATSDARSAWEATGSMGWKLDDNQIAILDEKAATLA